MNKFLEISHKALGFLNKYEKVHVVMGNESCDLDSAISALVYAYYLYKNFYSTAECGMCKIISIPLLNINEDEFLYRTETRYFLKKHNISECNLSFRNQIDLTDLSCNNKLKMTIVDHHVLPSKDAHLKDYVTEVLDHRPIDPSSNITTQNQLIDPVGSCCTLIAHKILQNNSTMTPEIAHLLHGTIILDTVNFNQDANRFKPLDIQITERLEKDYSVTPKRSEIYQELVNARSDTSSLTPFQVLHRDMKTLKGTPIPGLPTLITEFIKISDAADAFKKFCEKHKVSVIIPMGLRVENNIVHREIGVFCTEPCRLQNDLVEVLRGSSELNVEEIETDVAGLIVFKQNNVKMSRKHVIPIVSKIIERHVKNRNE